MKNELATIFMVFALVALALMIAALVLRIVRKRLASKILLAVACFFLAAYSIQFVVIAVNESLFSPIEYGYVFLFATSILLTIYILTTIFSKR